MQILPTTGTVYSDIENWVRRILKSPSQQSISSTTIADYVNRFYTYDAPARLQLFECKTQYVFETEPNRFIYQFPYQNFQMIEPPAYCDGVQMGFFQSNTQFYNIYPEFVNNERPICGSGIVGPYNITFTRNPILRGFRSDNPWQSFQATPPTVPPTEVVTYPTTLTPYVFITAFDIDHNFMYIVDGGDGILYQTDSTFQNPPQGPDVVGGVIVPPLVAGTVDYLHGQITFSFNNIVPAHEPINVQTSPYSPGTPRVCLFFNNQIKLFPVPSRAHKISMDAYITPAQFLNTSTSLPYGYMAEWIARGAARKILADNGDTEQIQLYEPFFREQEVLVLRRTERQNSTQRTPTIFCGQFHHHGSNQTQY